MSFDPRAYWVMLNRVKGVNPKIQRILLDRLGSVEEIFNCSWEDLVSMSRISLKTAKKIASLNENHFRAVESFICYVEENGITMLTPSDEGFPPGLVSLPDGPTLLYMVGSALPYDDKVAAIVGAREASPGGCKLAFELAQTLSEHGYTIVSGFAQGIDTAAHKGALNYDKGTTLAVLGCGVNRVFPPENEDLYNEIRFQGKGAFISEYPPDTGVSRLKLLARNRIISGISKFVIVIEGKKRGGTMETAECAIKQKRPVINIDWGKDTEKYGVNNVLKGKPGSVSVPAIKAVESILAFLEKGVLKYFSRPEQLDLPLE